MEEKSLATEILIELKEQNKRLFRTLVISIASFLSIICVVIGCFIWYLSLPVDDVSLEAKGGNANYNYVGEDMKGDMNYHHRQYRKWFQQYQSGIVRHVHSATTPSGRPFGILEKCY